MQSIPPRKKHCCRNARPHGNAEDAATASSMDVGKLPTRTRRTRVWGCMLGWKSGFPFAEKNLTAVAAVPVTLNLPLVAGRLGRPSRTIGTVRQ